MAELKDILEAMIFVHRGVLTRKVMEGVLKDDFIAAQIDEAISQLKREYGQGERVIRLLEVAGGFEFGTRGDLAEWIRKMDHYEYHRHLSRPALETLAIVAYRQPVTRAEIESIRGVNVDGITRSLLEKKLVKVLGRKDVPGKPMVYGTTSEFLVHFGLGSLADLPSLKEFGGRDAEGGGGQEEQPALILPLGEGERPEAPDRRGEEEEGENE